MSSEKGVCDVLVAGGGPAGRAVARACAEQGLDVVVVDPRPDAPWRHTYGVWEHELPADLPRPAVAAAARGVAVAVRTHELGDAYAILDTAALRAHLDHDGVRVRVGRVVGPADPGPGGLLADGGVVRAAVTVDATGAAQVLSTARDPGGTRAEQTAYGVVVDAATAARVTGGRLVLMDWRPLHGRAGWPTFLYAVPLGGGRVLLEETSLARRPGLSLVELRERLVARLRTHGLAADALPAADDPERVERVRFPVDTPRHRAADDVVAVGAAVPLVHPASGYSVASSLALAPRVATAVAAALDGRRPETAGAAARAVVTPPAARAVHAMRRRGLDVLLSLPPAEVPTFFDRFFSLPAEHRRAYLGADQDVAASLAAMTTLFARLPVRLRLRLVRGSLLGPGSGPPSEPLEGEDRDRPAAPGSTTSERVSPATLRRP